MHLILGRCVTSHKCMVELVTKEGARKFTFNDCIEAQDAVIHGVETVRRNGGTVTMEGSFDV